jgi:hypothetical protein
VLDLRNRLSDAYSIELMIYCISLAKNGRSSDRKRTIFDEVVEFG